MSARTFTVFQDSHDDTPSPSTSLLPATSLTEKENVHPLTGEATGPNITSKKRKTTVLANKALTIKTQIDDSKHEPKKRKASTSSSLKAKSTLKKDGKVSARKPTKRSVRKVSPLPKVEEEEASERERVAQAHINSKCYELTVQPLADVTPAYQQSPLAEGVILGEKAKLRFTKASSAEPDIRDYLSSPLPPSVPSASKLVCSSPEIKSFSTPERKQIYASFTFSSPSPSGKRFSAARSTACKDDKLRSPSPSP